MAALWSWRRRLLSQPHGRGETIAQLSAAVRARWLCLRNKLRTRRTFRHRRLNFHSAFLPVRQRDADHQLLLLTQPTAPHCTLRFGGVFYFDNLIPRTPPWPRRIILLFFEAQPSTSERGIVIKLFGSG